MFDVSIRALAAVFALTECDCPKQTLATPVKDGGGHQEDCRRIIDDGCDLLVALVIADRADKNGEGVYYSVPTIAGRSLLGERTVRRALESLRQHGIIEANQRPGRTTLYRLTLATLTTPVTATTLVREADTPATVAAHPGHSGRRSVKESNLLNQQPGSQGNDQWQCPHGACDGSGWIENDDTAQKCGCMPALVAHRKAKAAATR
jgi:DNA-binding transcriptional ArsR family regulator